MRRLVPALVLLAGMGGAAPAQETGADQATLAILGFAKDGSAFAYEQFGFQGQGVMPFSELSVIDTATGKFVSEGPFFSAIANRTGTIERVRRMTYTSARPVIEAAGISTQGIVAGRGSGDGDDEAAAKMTFELPTLGRVTLAIDARDVSVKGCTRSKVQALTLHLDDGQGKKLRELFAEKEPPAARLCPAAYGLAEVRYFPREGKAPVLAAIVGFDRPGQGGLSRRYLAVVVDLAVAPEPPKEAPSGH